MEAGVEPIGVHARQVLDLELDQRSTELARVAKLDGKSIYTTLALVIRGVVGAHTSFIFHATGPDVQEELDDGVGW
jgi:hypothetical protein